MIKVKTNGVDDLFGTTFRYRKIFHSKTEYKEFVTIEEIMPGKFSKYINNTGKACVDPTDAMAHKVECLAHFANERTK